MKRSICIDVLKVIATAMVFFCHSTIVASEVFDFKASGWLRVFNTPAWGGVWMFLIFSGFLAASGFGGGGKYSLTKSGIAKYYLNRVIKILVPTWIFVSMAFIFYYREVDLQYNVLLRVFFCLFNGPGFSVKGIGAIWYICIVAWLYLLTPLFVYILNNFEDKHRGEEFKSYLKLAFLIASIGLLYRLGGYFLHINWYDWLYANPIACFDLFFIGIVASRVKKYLPECKADLILRYRKYLIWFFVMLVITCTLKPWILTKFYQFVSPTFFLFGTLGLLLLYSYDVENNITPFARKIGEWMSLICPYTFAFYLWHTLLLMSVANKLPIENNTLHYLIMLVVGFCLTSYVAFIVTKMNEGIINTLLKKTK